MYTAAVYSFNFDDESCDAMQAFITSTAVVKGARDNASIRYKYGTVRFIAISVLSNPPEPYGVQY